MSALAPITDVGRSVQVSIWLSVYEYNLAITGAADGSRWGFHRSRNP